MAILYTACVALLPVTEYDFAACSPSVSIEWSRRDGAALSSSTASVADYGRVLSLRNVTQTDSGQYVCHASNKIGDATATLLLTVDGIIKADCDLFPVKGRL